MDECIIDMLLKMNLDIEEIKKSVCKQGKKQSIIPSKDLVDNEEVCRSFKISKDSLRRWRKQKLIPFLKIGGKYYYDLNEIKAKIREKHYGS